MFKHRKGVNKRCLFLGYQRIRETIFHSKIMTIAIVKSDEGIRHYQHEQDKHYILDVVVKGINH